MFCVSLVHYDRHSPNSGSPNLELTFEIYRILSFNSNKIHLEISRCIFILTPGLCMLGIADFLTLPSKNDYKLLILTDCLVFNLGRV